MAMSLEQVRADLPNLKGPVPGPRARAAIERDMRHVSPSYTRCYPLVVERGEGAVIEDVDGNRFLDFNAGIAVVATGHCHPKVVKAIQEQAARLIHMSGTDFYYEGMIALAEKLSQIAPGAVDRRVSFGNSGAEAMEGAIKLARWSTGRDKIIAFLGSFHGRTMGALSLTARKAVQRAGFGPMVPGVVHAPYPYCYRCPYGKQPDSCAVECVQHIENTLLKTISPAEETAAIVVEPIQGEGGYIVPPKKFFEELARVAKENGILLVFDEVQSGMGRTGKLFAHEWSGITPDVMSVAKGIGGGFPLGAVLAKEQFAKALVPGTHGTTYGGNPLACAAGNAVLDIILAPGFLESVERKGAKLRSALDAIAREFPQVYENARGMGLLQGLKCVLPVGQVQAACVAEGLMAITAGENVLRLAPPLVVTDADLDEAIAMLRRATQKVVPSSAKAAAQ